MGVYSRRISYAKEICQC